eukprot:TRINITY_DN49132_c0_g1_i3.p1 TRINITY_DN49132_c0_g1~~TRINITY_DN49132_c0_g1_i3.p1  ORF type:complete len:597 (+),score=126.88 TRINITY_DN49132_c0_g1_i3:166-1956(+)
MMPIMQHQLPSRFSGSELDSSLLRGLRLQQAAGALYDFSVRERVHGSGYSSEGSSHVGDDDESAMSESVRSLTSPTGGADLFDDAVGSNMSDEFNDFLQADDDSDGSRSPSRSPALSPESRPPFVAVSTFHEAYGDAGDSDMSDYNSRSQDTESDGEMSYASPPGDGSDLEDDDLASTVVRPPELPTVSEESLQELWPLGKDSFTIFVCPITHDILSDPVVGSDGHTYERSAITRWFETSRKSPVTGQTLRSTELVPNHSVRTLLKWMIDNVQEAKADAKQHAKASGPPSRQTSAQSAQVTESAQPLAEEGLTQPAIRQHQQPESRQLQQGTLQLVSPARMENRSLDIQSLPPAPSPSAASLDEGHGQGVDAETASRLRLRPFPTSESVVAAYIEEAAREGARMPLASLRAAEEAQVGQRPSFPPPPPPALTRSVPSAAMFMTLQPAQGDRSLPLVPPCGGPAGDLAGPDGEAAPSSTRAAYRPPSTGSPQRRPSSPLQRRAHRLADDVGRGPATASQPSTPSAANGTSGYVEPSTVLPPLRGTAQPMSAMPNLQALHGAAAVARDTVASSCEGLSERAAQLIGSSILASRQPSSR